MLARSSVCAKILTISCIAGTLLKSAMNISFAFACNSRVSRGGTCSELEAESEGKERKESRDIRSKEVLRGGREGSVLVVLLRSCRFARCSRCLLYSVGPTGLSCQKSRVIGEPLLSTSYATLPFC